ncbi:MAG: PPC domain-containing DNA-binding protein [Armatimonadota bacterium]
MRYTEDIPDGEGGMMEYTQGTLGRVFVARLQEGESVYDSVEEIARKEGILSAAVFAVGGMRRGKVVTGPEQLTGKIVPHFEEFDDARELVGVGTLFPQEGRPSLHFHAGIGRGSTALVGCPRAGMAVFLVLEVIIIELCGIDAQRVLEPEFGVHLLKILGGTLG